MRPGTVHAVMGENRAGKKYLSPGWFDTSVDGFRRPHRWDEGEGHAAIKFSATPIGIVGSPTLATADKSKRPIVAICRMLTTLVEEILDKFPPRNRAAYRGSNPAHRRGDGTPYLREPGSPGWKSVYTLPRSGPVEKM